MEERREEGREKGGGEERGRRRREREEGKREGGGEERGRRGRERHGCTRPCTSSLIHRPNFSCAPCSLAKKKGTRHFDLGQADI